MGFGEPDKKEDITETLIINTNISIVDNHETISKNDISSVTEVSIDKAKLNRLKLTKSFKDNTLKKEEVSVLSTDTSSSSSLVNLISTDENTPNLITEKSDDVEIKKESIEENLENNTELKPNDHIENINSGEDKISVIEKGKQLSTTNKKKSLYKSDIDRAANNLSRDFTKEIVVTDDNKTTTQPVKKAQDVIIADQKERFTKDYISSTTTIKKESIEKNLKNTTEIKPNDQIEKFNSSEGKISVIEKGKQISTINKKKSLDKSDIDRAANNLSRDFTKEIVVTDDNKTTTQPVKKAQDVIIADQKERFTKDYISSTTAIKKESTEETLENTTEVKPNIDLGKLNSSDNNISEINTDDQLSTVKKEKGTQNTNIGRAANNLFNEEEDDIVANANNFSRDFTKDIVITDYKKTTKPEKKAPEIIIKEQKERFKKDYVSSTRTIKKEEVLVINSIDVSTISIKNNGKYIETSKSDKVDVMRINFQIDNNKYITSGYKEVYILIQSPSGTILNRKGTFEMKNGKELTYTEKTNAYYNNNHLNISMVTDRFIQRIVKGVYTITIYIEGYPVGLEMLELS
jgi:hypothetical protein